MNFQLANGQIGVKFLLGAINYSHIGLHAYVAMIKNDDNSRGGKTGMCLRWNNP